MNSLKIKAIAESAAGAALSALLIAIAIYFPAAMGIIAVFCGVPVMYIFYKHNTVAGVLTFVSAFLVAFILSGDIVSVALLTLIYILPVAVFAFLNSKGQKFSVSLAAAALVTLVGVIIEFNIMNGSGTGIRDFLSAYLNQIQSAARDAVASSGLEIGVDITAVFSQVAEIVIDGIMYYLPTAVICISVFYAFLVVMVGAFVLKRLRVKNIEHTKFNEIVLPRFVCHITVLLYVITFIIKDSNVYVAALKNIVMLSEIALGLCGFAFLDLKFSKVLKQPVIRVIIYIGAWFSLFMLVPFLAEACVLIGFFRSMYHMPSNNDLGGGGFEK